MDTAPPTQFADSGMGLGAPTIEAYAGGQARHPKSKRCWSLRGSKLTWLLREQIQQGNGGWPVSFGAEMLTVRAQAVNEVGGG